MRGKIGSPADRVGRNLAEHIKGDGRPDLCERGAVLQAMLRRSSRRDGRERRGALSRERSAIKPEPPPIGAG